MLMPNSGRFVRLCVRLTIFNLLKVYMNLFSDFFVLNFLKFLNRLRIYGANGLWSGATPISDGIFIVCDCSSDEQDIPENKLKKLIICDRWLDTTSKWNFFGVSFMSILQP